MARKLQEEIEQLERDKRLAVEAQDRELAKVLYEKVKHIHFSIQVTRSQSFISYVKFLQEKARLKRAKERSRLKAAAAAEAAGGGVTNQDYSSSQSELEDNHKQSHDTRSASINSPTPSSSSQARARASPSSSSRRSEPSPRSSFHSESQFPATPPKIPEKTSKSSIGRDDPIGFRANQIGRAHV